MNKTKLWKRYRKYLVTCDDLGLSLDVSRVRFKARFLEKMEPPLQNALQAMDQLEAGAIANPDENRMVGHYWLRKPELAPDPTLGKAISSSLASIATFTEKVHSGKIHPPASKRFTDVLLIGIGGSALGPQLVCDALANLSGKDRMKVHFMDNTDPDGIQAVLTGLGARLKSTLVIVISKSGGTPETRNGMLEAQAFFAAKDLAFAPQAVAITGEDSKLDQVAKKEKWLLRLPMWDWVGGRTSVMAAVGLLPMALQGIDIQAFLAGAAAMDEHTRSKQTSQNPAAMLALMWYAATGGKGKKDMVMLPYKDRLLLLSRYLQQLVMESIGKELDLDGNPVFQGIAVYGNKGSTDQHAYVQQLRDGLDNFFASFIVVKQDLTAAARRAKTIEVEPGITSGDYLLGFWQGTREALHEAKRDSLTLFLETLDARSLGAVIALYERAVGLYATLVNINAYHQPGVEAGKKAAAAVLDLQKALVAALKKSGKTAVELEALVAAIGAEDHIESAYHTLEHLVANGRLSREGSAYRAHG